jgi:hypothetical protein
MSTHGINAIGVLVGNPDEIVFVLTKGDVDRVYNMMNNLDLGNPLPESVWSSFKKNMYKLDDMLDHAEALEVILNNYCRVPVTMAPPPPVAVAPAPVAVAPPSAPVAVAPPSAPVAVAPVPVDIYADWDARQRKRYDTKVFCPPGYGHHVMWSAHRVRSFMLALKMKPTVYDTNLRALATKAGVHPYDFRWNVNPVVFGGKMGLSDYQMKCMMGARAFDEMRMRFAVNGFY